MPLKYFADMPGPVVVLGTAHGFLYALFLLAAFDLALRGQVDRRRAPCSSLLAGTVPFLSFYAERNVTRKTRAGERV